MEIINERTNVRTTFLAVAFLLSAFALFEPAEARAQWTSGGGTTTTPDKVGVGTSNPANGKLEVTSDGGVTSGEHSLLFGSRSGAGSVGFKFGYRADGTSSTGGFVKGLGNLSFFLGTEGTPQALTIKNAGNVGVGTTSPGSVNGLDFSSSVLFHVKGGTSGAFIMADGAATGTGFVINDSSQAANSRLWGLSQGAGNGRLSFSAITDTGTFAHMMVIDRTGNVGIGTGAGSTNPAYKLDVAGAVRSLSGGFIFPDGTVQATAASGTITGVTAGNGLTGEGAGGIVTLNVGAGTGLTVAPDSISVNYGSTAGTAVQGNTSMTLTAGSGMSGGGSVTLGTGGSVTLTNTDKGSEQNIFKNVANGVGATQFTAGSNNDALRIEGTGGTDVSFDATAKKVTINSAAPLGFGSTVGTAVQGNTTLTVSAGVGLSGGGTSTLGAGGTLTLTNTDLGSSQSIFKNVANAAGTAQFSAGTNNDSIRFEGTGGTSVSFDAATKRVVINSSATTSNVAAAHVSAGQFGAGNFSFPGNVDISGRLTWGNANSRTDTKDDAGASATRSGFFETSAPVNYPAGSAGWWHLIESRHSNPANNYALQIAGSFFDQNLYVRKTNVDNNTTSATTAWSKFILQDSSGKVGIGTDTPSAKLDVTGNVNTTGDMTVSGTIRGGVIEAKYQDVAEWVESSQKLEAGTVVALDPERSNQVLASSEAYDTKVAGVISGQPGISLGERGEGKVLVATTGRVKVRVDATRAPIKIGDLLVTSDVQGVAMKSEPVSVGGRRMHSPGTLIGKALEPLDKGTGIILVLLSLQ